jgi:RNA polymerase sigma factor (sigma-70 family)
MSALELIEAASRGDRAAVRALVERLFPVVRARVRVMQARRPDLRALDSKDLVQQVFVCLLDHDARQLTLWNPERGATLEGYVGMVTEREIGNAGQRAATRERHELMTGEEADAPVEQPSPETQAVARDEANRLGVFLDGQLPPKGRVVLKCLYTDGLDAEPGWRRTTDGAPRCRPQRWR